MALGTSWPNPRGSMMATHYKFPKGLLILVRTYMKVAKISTNKWTRHVMENGLIGISNIGGVLSDIQY